MRTLIRFLGLVIVLGAVGLGAAWWWAGRAEGPAVDLKRPGKFIGRSTAVELSVQAPGGQFSSLDISVDLIAGPHLRQGGMYEAAEREDVLRFLNDELHARR